MGTLNFASINAHNLYEQSRRDDLESVAYMLIYFYLGKLDWIQNEPEVISDFESENNYVKNLKRLLGNDNNIPKVLMEFYKQIRTLEFEERPNYEKYIDNFREELVNV
jgi:hypothetical protein